MKEQIITEEGKQLTTPVTHLDNFILKSPDAEFMLTAPISASRLSRSTSILP